MRVLTINGSPEIHGCSHRALKEAGRIPAENGTGCRRVERKVLQDYPHGYGTGGNHNVRGHDFDTFLSGIMSGSSAIDNVGADMEETTGREVMYDLYGRQVPADTAKNGIYIVKSGQKATKILKR